ncbi:MAG: cytochrome c-type biogenesis protein CcmH [Bryobacteraceae bacterium]|nr:cytochrome c-type biogenesis protein CcmH [Bryobacteraceae bacterium]MDW8379715.1 cytochrome c-type biogenesis protein CcmH [Bryobacterales bacterium]
MRQLQNRLLLILTAGLCMAQSSTEYLTPAVRRVGEKLACLCGACKNTVASCQMLGCHYAGPAREKIAKMLAAGMSDQAIIDEFVRKEGLRALAVPPLEGFNLLGWVMPFVAIGIGLAGIYLFIRRFHKPAVASAPTDAALLDKYHEQIEKDLAKLD